MGGGLLAVYDCHAMRGNYHMKNYPCQKCLSNNKTALVFFQSNVSYFFARRIKSSKSYLCAKCINSRFIEFELTTLFGTWWGVTGVIVGPFYLIRNIVECVMGHYDIRRSNS